LFDDSGDSHDHSKSLSKLQAAHVSIISLSSCVGRITAGTSSDILLQTYGLPRTWCLVCASVVAILAQLSGWFVDTIDYLVNLSVICSNADLKYIVSCLAGFAYGLLFGCSPVIGMTSFLSSNLYIASELFGIEYLTRIHQRTDIDVGPSHKIGGGSALLLHSQVPSLIFFTAKLHNSTSLISRSYI
jgi:hypothetical protein